MAYVFCAVLCCVVLFTCSDDWNKSVDPKWKVSIGNDIRGKTYTLYWFRFIVLLCRTSHQMTLDMKNIETIHKEMLMLQLPTHLFEKIPKHCIYIRHSLLKTIHI